MTDPQTYFREATDTLEPDVDALGAGGLDRGRARRRRRTALATVGAGAVVAVLAVGAAAAPQLLRADAPVAPAGRGGDDRRAVDPTPQPTTEPTTGPRTVTMEPDDVAMVFGDLVGGDIAGDQAFPGDHGGVIAHFRWNGAYTSMIVDGFLDDRTPLAECRAMNGGTGFPCEQRADGSVLSAWQEQQPLQDGGVTGRGATLYTTDGWSVAVISYNAADPKSFEHLSPAPQLSVDQAEQVVTSEAWFAEPGGPTPEPTD